MRHRRRIVLFFSSWCWDLGTQRPRKRPLRAYRARPFEWGSGKTSTKGAIRRSHTSKQSADSSNFSFRLVRRT